MAVRISSKIKSYSVVGADSKPAPGKAEAAAVVAPGTPEPIAHAKAEVIQMHERLERPEVLIGSTYKIKSPLVEHAMYVTINDIVLNPGTEYELRRPFEVFINSKNMDHFQWIVALTRIMSAVFRKGGDCTFLVDEMKAVFDPRGGYFKAGGVYMPSIVGEIGAVIEEHMKMIGLIVDDELSPEQQKLIAEKRAAYDARASKSEKKNTDVGGRKSAPAKPGSEGVTASGRSAPTATLDHQEDISITGDGASFPPSATMCHKCNTKALVLMDGCATCLNCGYSKCG